MINQLTIGMIVYKQLSRKPCSIHLNPHDVHDILTLIPSNRTEPKITSERWSNHHFAFKPYINLRRSHKYSEIKGLENMLLPAKQSTLKLLPPHFGPGWGSFTWWVWHKKHVQWAMDVMDMALDQTCMKHQSSVDHWIYPRSFFGQSHTGIPHPYHPQHPAWWHGVIARSLHPKGLAQNFGQRRSDEWQHQRPQSIHPEIFNIQTQRYCLVPFTEMYDMYSGYSNVIYITLSHILSLYESHFIHHEWGVHMKQPHQSPWTIDVQPPCSSWCWNFDGRSGRRGPCVEALALGRKTRMRVSLDWFKGKSTGNHGFYHQILGFPVNFPIIQFYESYDSWSKSSFITCYNLLSMLNRSHLNLVTPYHHWYTIVTIRIATHDYIILIYSYYAVTGMHIQLEMARWFSEPGCEWHGETRCGCRHETCGDMSRCSYKRHLSWKTS